MAHDDLDICDNGKRVFFINETIGCSSENDIGNELGLLIDSMMLSDGYGHCEMIILKVGAHVLISEDHIDTNYGILGVLGSLQEQIHIDVLDTLQLSLTCLNLLVIFVIFGGFLLGLRLCGGLRIGFSTFGSSCSLGVGFAWCRSLSRSATLLVVLLFVFLLGFVANSS